MEINQLKYFIAVCEELHFTRAAEKLNISQPSLSQQISILESQIGMPLFDRIGKKIRITETGELLLNHSHNIFNELKQFRSSVDELQNFEKGQVSIGGLLSVVTSLLPSVITRYHELYPKINLTIKGLKSDDIYEKLIQGDLDLGILIHDEKSKYKSELNSVPLYTEEYALAVPTTHELANVNYVSLKVLEKTSNILFPKDYFTRQILDNHCKELGFKLTSSIEMTTMESTITMVGQGAGVTVLPTSYLKFNQFKKIKIIPLINFPSMGEIRIYSARNKRMTRAAEAFLNEVVFSFKNNTNNIIP